MGCMEEQLVNLFRTDAYHIQMIFSRLLNERKKETDSTNSIEHILDILDNLQMALVVPKFIIS